MVSVSNFSISANVRKSVLLFPSSVDMVLQKGSTSEVNFEMYNIGTGTFDWNMTLIPFNVSAAVSSSSLALHGTRGVLKAGTGVPDRSRLAINTTGLPEGLHLGRLVFTTSLKVKIEVKIEVFVQVTKSLYFAHLKTFLKLNLT